MTGIGNTITFEELNKEFNYFVKNMQKINAHYSSRCSIKLVKCTKKNGRNRYSIVVESDYGDFCAGQKVPLFGACLISDMFYHLRFANLALMHIEDMK